MLHLFGLFRRHHRLAHIVCVPYLLNGSLVSWFTLLSMFNDYEHVIIIWSFCLSQPTFSFVLECLALSACESQGTPDRRDLFFLSLSPPSLSLPPPPLVGTRAPCFATPSPDSSTKSS